MVACNASHIKIMQCQILTSSYLDGYDICTSSSRKTLLGIEQQLAVACLT